MDTKTLLELIEGGESSKVELKIVPPRPSEVAQRLCGFANTGGGYLILGVKDETLELVGLKNVGDAIDTILQATRLCKPTIVLNPQEPENYVIKGQNIVVATIPPNNGTLYQVSGVCWVRRGSHTVPMELAEIESHLYSRGTISWERKPVEEATLADLDEQLVRELVATRPAQIRKAGRLDNLEELLISLNCAVRTGEETLRPTNARMLLFGNYPQRFIIQAEITCVLYTDNLGTRRYADRRILSGSVGELIDGAENFFKQYVPIPARMEGFHRVDEPEYPLEVLREALVNAVVHRDYSQTGESIRVFYYPDRIEIRNPGLLLPGLTVEDLEQGRIVSKLRNPVLAGVLRDLPGGYMERMGSGIKYMQEEMARLGHPRPIFKELGEFIVTFYKNLPEAQSRLDSKDKSLPSGSISEPQNPILDTAIAGSVSNSIIHDSTTLIEARLEKIMRYSLSPFRNLLELTL